MGFEVGFTGVRSWACKCSASLEAMCMSVVGLLAIPGMSRVVMPIGMISSSLLYMYERSVQQQLQ